MTPEQQETPSAEEIKKKGMYAAAHITLSAHEWTWSKREQIAMALALMEFSKEHTKLYKDCCVMREALASAYTIAGGASYSPMEKWTVDSLRDEMMNIRHTITPALSQTYPSPSE